MIIGCGAFLFIIFVNLMVISAEAWDILPWTGIAMAVVFFAMLINIPNQDGEH